ncbi:ribonuclease H-like domain-containing protein [Tanacetum coccineum]
MHAPLKSHLQAALNVLRYLKGSPGKGLRYDHTSISATDEMVSYADSDWDKCPKTRKSVSSYCVFLNGCLVSWKSKKQATLSKSSTKVEYRFLMDEKFPEMMPESGFNDEEDEDDNQPGYFRQIT